MRFGCCTSMVALQPDGTGVEKVEQLKEIGYDYVELSLIHMMALSDEEIFKLREKVSLSGIKCEACHNFIPSNLKITGSDADIDSLIAHANKAIRMASWLGAQVIVFGSGPAKKVPDGFAMDKAWRQLVDFLREVDTIAEKNGITIVNEPLRKAECNIINSIREGLELVKDVNRNNIKLLADFYHMSIENEDPKIIVEAGDNIRHVHLAKVEGRVFPRNIEEDEYMPFITNLKRAGYNWRVSVEAYSKDFYNDAVQSLSLLKNNFL